jgi:hypothetical protein
MRSWGTWAFFALLCSSTTAQAQLAPAGRAGLTSIDYVFLERELTLPDGIVEIGGRLQTVQIDYGFFEGDVTGIAATVGYGAADVFEIWGEPVLILEPDAELGLNVGASVRAVNGQSFDMAPSLVVPFNITGDGDAVPYLGLGLDSRIALGSVVSLYVLHGLVTFAFSAETVFLSANLGLGLQPVKMFGIRIETRPFLIETSEGETLHYGDVIPLGIDLIVNVKSVDLFFAVQFPSVEDAGDFYALNVGAMGRF